MTRGLYNKLMDSTLDNKIITLEVLNVFDIRSNNWNFLIRNLGAIIPQKIIQLSQKSTELARIHAPAKEVKRYPGHFIVNCSIETVPLGHRNFKIYLHKGITNIEYTDNSKNQTNTEKDDLRRELDMLTAEKNNINIKIKKILISLLDSTY